MKNKLCYLAVVVGETGGGALSVVSGWVFEGEAADSAGANWA